MSLIVSDTTPISCLLRIGRPDLLATLFPDLRIPTESPRSSIGEQRSSAIGAP
jgi:hypothetical protein